MSNGGGRGGHDRPDFEVWVVDDVSEGIAVLYEVMAPDDEGDAGAPGGDDGTAGDDETQLVVEVAAKLLGDRAVEGAVLRVPLGDVGEPMWERAERDPEAEEDRRRWASETLERLRQRDPGGDLST